MRFDREPSTSLEPSPFEREWLDEPLFIWKARKEDGQLNAGSTDFDVYDATIDWGALFEHWAQEIIITQLSGEYMGKGSEFDALPRGYAIAALASVLLENRTYSDARTWTNVNAYLMQHVKQELQKMGYERAGLVVQLGEIVIRRRVGLLEARLLPQPLLFWGILDGSGTKCTGRLPVHMNPVMMFEEYSAITVRMFTTKFLDMVPEDKQDDLRNDATDCTYKDPDTWETFNVYLAQLAADKLRNSGCSAITVGVIEIEPRDRMARMILVRERFVHWVQNLPKRAVQALLVSICVLIALVYKYSVL